MVFGKIKEIINDIFCEETEITPDMKLMNDLGLDSLDMIEMIYELEDEYDVEIDETEREKIKTVSELVKAVESKL